MSLDNRRFSVLIVDDEKEACINLKNILTEYVDPGINIAGVAHNTIEAEKQIHKLSPDALFLDIEMPNENAFNFLDRISPLNFEVIFVTAYDEYAIRAFKLNAVDYILKPISIAELKNAYEKLKVRLHYKKIATQNISYTDLSKQVKYKFKSQKIIIKDGNGVEVVEFKDIYFIEAQGSYSKILFLKDGSLKESVMSNTLSDYEELLPTNFFYRIHKSYLINCSNVIKILREDSLQVMLGYNITLPVSRRRVGLLLDFLKNNDFHYE